MAKNRKHIEPRLPAQPSVEDDLPFVMRVADNERVQGVLYGTEAMKAAGAQTEFIAHNILQAQGMKSSLILRAGSPPQYNKKRGPKSGVNLSKTSNQGFFKGSIAKEERFARLDDKGHPKAHHYKDHKNLEKDISNPDYQHVMPLDINMMDIVRETGPDGDMELIDYNDTTGMLRLRYKKGRGPQDPAFTGQFAINIYQGEANSNFNLRPWENIENHPDWDPASKSIKQPNSLKSIDPSSFAVAIRHNLTYQLLYSEQQEDIPEAEYQKAEVFANRPRTAEEFKESMGSEHPLYAQIADAEDLESLLSHLNGLEGGREAILDVYNKAGRIVAGDWDGLALGHPPGLNPRYTQVYNTFSPSEGPENMAGLLAASEDYLQELKQAAQARKDHFTRLVEQSTEENSNIAHADAEADSGFTAFDKLVLNINQLDREVVSEFALARAGCITAHEFVFSQVLNHAYADPSNSIYGENYNKEAVDRTYQEIRQKIHQQTRQGAASPMEIYRHIVLDLEETLDKHLENTEDRRSSITISRSPSDSGNENAAFLEVPHERRRRTSEADRHKMLGFLQNVIRDEVKQAWPEEPKIAERHAAHMEYDQNVQNLYQHGFDMRNPYGSNLEGSWLLVTEDGGVLYGSRQEQLVEVMLTPGFLEKNQIDVNFAADMSAGWDRIVARQLDLKQRIPDKTLVAYAAHLHTEKKYNIPSTAKQEIAAAIKRCEALPKNDDFAKTLKNAKIITSSVARFKAFFSSHKTNNTEAQQDLRQEAISSKTKGTPASLPPLMSKQDQAQYKDAVRPEKPTANTDTLSRLPPLKRR